MRPAATRFVNLEYDTERQRMSIVYDPDNIGGSRTSFVVQPWHGKHEFVVDESQSAGCEVWMIRVCVEFEFDAQLEKPASNVRVSYDLDEFDCNELIKAHAR